MQLYTHCKPLSDTKLSHRPPRGHPHAIHRPSAGHPHAIHRPPTCHTQATHRPPTCLTQATYRPPTCHTQATHRPPTCHTQATPGHASMTASSPSEEFEHRWFEPSSSKTDEFEIDTCHVLASRSQLLELGAAGWHSIKIM